MPFMKRKTTDNIVSLLGKGAEMTGEIAFTNGLRVEGVIKGKVRSEATLVIGPGGLVDAEVSVRRISINGEFHGVIHAADRVEIHKDGKVVGDIFSPCLIIEAGAIFDGRCNMSDEKKPALLKNDAPAVKAAESDKDK
jgi:cytoskeletal protein CcmA (bactofilin family)